MPEALTFAGVWWTAERTLAVWFLVGFMVSSLSAVWNRGNEPWPLIWIVSFMVYTIVCVFVAAGAWAVLTVLR